MVTTRQFTYGVVRTVRGMDRAAKQAERQRLARQQAMLRQANLAAAAQAAAEYDQTVEALTGAHRVTMRRRDWLTDATAAPPVPPERQTFEETAAAERLEAYAPGWLTRVLGRETKARELLADEVVEARWRDDAAHQVALAAADARNAVIETARKVVARDLDAMAQALSEHSSLGSIPFSVEGVNVSALGERVVALVDGVDLGDIPTNSVALLKSGKASVKALPAGRRQELHRDAVCSAAIRVAVEFLSTLPLDEVEVVMLTDVLDRGTGHIAAAPVLHLRATVQALATLNLPRTEPMALVERIGGHLDWSKRDGFKPINAAAFGLDLND